MKSDRDLKKAVEDQLKWEPDIDETDMGVSVSGGVVALSGFTHSFGQKWGAENAAKRVAGVVGIANDIVVRLPQGAVKPDPEIARDAVSALKLQCSFYSEGIQVIVRDGWVTLEGQVDWGYQRNALENTIRWLSGVKGITNLVRVSPKVSVGDIRKKIEDAFRRNAEVDARNVTIEVQGGKVALRGTVHSWAERREAERESWSAPGVTEVENQLHIAA